MRTKILGWICVALLAAPTLSNAALYLVADEEAAVVIDTVRNRTWLADLSLSGRVSQAEAFAWVDTLNAGSYRGHSDWRLPHIARFEEVWVTDMGNEMWGERHVLPFDGIPIFRGRLDLE